MPVEEDTLGFCGGGFELSEDDGVTTLEGVRDERCGCCAELFEEVFEESCTTTAFFGVGC
jgi:hypothetical protein